MGYGREFEGKSKHYILVLRWVQLHSESPKYIIPSAGKFRSHTLREGQEEFEQVFLLFAYIYLWVEPQSARLET